MINLLDLRPQVSTAPNGPPQNSGSDGEGFASMYGERGADDATPGDAMTETWGFPGAAAVPIQQSRPAVSGKPMFCPTGHGGDAAGKALTRPQADAKANADTAAVAPETAGLSGVEDLPVSPATDPALEGEAQMLSVPENGSNRAKIAETAGPGRPRKGDGPVTGVVRGPHPDADRKLLTDVQTGASRHLPQPVGPVVARQAGGSPKADAIQVTAVQVQVTGLPVAAAMLRVNATTEITDVATDTPTQEPEGAAGMATRPAAPNHAGRANSPFSGATHPEVARATPFGTPEGMDLLAREHAEHGPDGTPVVQVSTSANGPAAISASPSAGPVTAAVIAAIPPASTATDRVEVILSPEELGRVQMEFRAEGEGIRVFLTAERPETLDLLRRHADQLSAELRQAGYSGASLAFGHWGQPQGEARHNGRTGTIPPAESHIPASTPAFHRKNMSGHGLDLRI